EPEDAEALEDQGPGVEEGRVDVEEDEDHADEVELDREALSRVADGRHATLVDRVLGRVRPRPPQELRHDEREHGEAERNDAEDEQGSVGGKVHPVPAEVLESLTLIRTPGQPGATRKRGDYSFRGRRVSTIWAGLALARAHPRLGKQVG